MRNTEPRELELLPEPEVGDQFVITMTVNGWTIREVVDQGYMIPAGQVWVFSTMVKLTIFMQKTFGSY